MPVSRKYAVLMLAIVVLWAALPVLACVTPAPLSCCQGMMLECSTPAMTAPSPCCQLHSPVPVVPADRAYAPEQAPSLAPFQAVVPLTALQGMRGEKLENAEASPPPLFSGGTSILRV